MEVHPIVKLGVRYPQLQLIVNEGMSESHIYSQVVRGGRGNVFQTVLEVQESDIEKDNDLWGFSMSKHDSLAKYTYSCGIIEVLVLSERADFELFLRKTIYRCEPKHIPSTMGAMLIKGLINWEKIRENEEEKKNRDSIIVLSTGAYSNLGSQVLGLEHEEWMSRSLVIRKYHEITHFLCGQLFPSKKEVLWDEVLADCIGLMFAFGKYDKVIAHQILGICNKNRTGRIWNYQFQEPMEKVIQRAEVMIDKLTTFVCSLSFEKDDLEVIIKKIYKYFNI